MSTRLALLAVSAGMTTYAYVNRVDWLFFVGLISTVIFACLYGIFACLDGMSACLDGFTGKEDK